MLKRIAIYLLGLLVAGLLVCGYFWLNDRQIRRQTAKDLNAFFADEMAQKNALESLGDIDL
jgi:hypothetical protein